MLIINRLRNSAFFRHVFVLATGTAIAHIVTLGSLPVLTRLYSPEEFGVFGVFVAVFSLFGVVANFRYEIAIPLPDSDRRAANLACVALLCAAVTTLVLALVVFFWGAEISSFSRLSVLRNYFYLIPIGVFFGGAYSVFQYWATRRKEFKRIAKTRVEQALGGVITQIALGLFGVGALGLMLGQVINSCAGFFGLARRSIKEDGELWRNVSSAEMISVAKEYERFPKFSYAEALANMGGVQLPLLVIGVLATEIEVGFLMLGMRLMQAPVGLIGASISQVFFSRAVEEEKKSELANLVSKAFEALLKTGVGPLLFAGIIAPKVFPLIFGENWFRAGVLVAWMTPWFVFQFLTQPVSMVMHVTGNQKLASVLQIFGLIFRVGSVAIGGLLLSTSYLSEVYAISGGVFYLLYLCLVLMVSKVSLASLLKSFRRVLPITLGWVGCGLIFVLIVEKFLKA